MRRSPSSFPPTFLPVQVSSMVIIPRFRIVVGTQERHRSPLRFAVGRPARLGDLPQTSQKMPQSDATGAEPHSDIDRWRFLTASGSPQRVQVGMGSWASTERPDIGRASPDCRRQPPRSAAWCLVGVLGLWLLLAVDGNAAHLGQVQDDLGNTDARGTQVEPTSGPKTNIDFNGEIRPILAAKCFACHGPDAEDRHADLRLDTYEGATDWAIVPGDVEASELWSRLVTDDPNLLMPPPDSGKQRLSE